MQIRYSVVPDPDIITEGEQTTSGIICSVHVVVHGDVMLSADLVSFLVLSLVSFLSLYNMFQLYCVEYKEWWNPEEEEIVIQPRKQEANQITNGDQKEQVTHITIVSKEY